MARRHRFGRIFTHCLSALLCGTTAYRSLMSRFGGVWIGCGASGDYTLWPNNSPGVDI
jgi:hypothetical protein